MKLTAITSALVVCVLVGGSAVAQEGDLWYSTEIDFTSGGVGWITPVYDGDLLTLEDCIYLRNNQLTANLGIMPPVPDLGLDAVTREPADPTTEYPRPILFSLETTVWSETLGTILHGDLLSMDGTIVRRESELWDAFDPLAIPISGTGLDAVNVPLATYPIDMGYLFSVEVGFYSLALGRYISDGDLLAEAGFVYRTHAQLMQYFHPLTAEGEPMEPDFGLDAVWVAPNGTVYFSVDEGFRDRVWGRISDGDLLCETGWVIRRNLELVDECDPIEDVDNFGLDALHHDGNIHLTPESLD